MGFRTLSELEAGLKAQAGSGALSFDATFLPQRVLGLFSQYLPPLKGALLLSAGAQTKITLESTSNPQRLWVQGVTLPSAGEQVPLHLPGCRADAMIQQTTPGDETGYDLVLRLTLPEAWTFGDSLPPLGGLQPPGYLATPAGQFLYLSSFQSPQPLPPFPGEPVPAEKGAVLATGLDYRSELELAGIFALAEELLGLHSVRLPLLGSVTPEPEEEPTVTLEAKTGLSSLAIGFLELEVPFVGVETAWTELDEVPYPTLLFFVGTTITIDGVPLEVRAIFAGADTSGFMLTLGAPGGKGISLLGLAEKLLHTNAGEMEKEAGPLREKLRSIALESFSAYVAFDSGPSIRYLQAKIGTEPPWELDLGPLGTKKLDLTFTWTTLFLSGESTSTASFEALLEISKEPELSFDVTVELPQLAITGSERGTIDLSLEELGDIFGIDLPKELLKLRLTNFQVAMTTDAGGSVSTFALSGEASLSLALFGTPLLALENVRIGLLVEPQTKQRTLNLDGTVVLGGSLALAGSATVTNAKDAKTVFSLHLVNETVGSMLNHLVHLVDPTFDITLPAPWDRFLAISLDAFVLEVNVTDKTVALEYAEKIDLEFLVLERVKLTYAKEPKKGAESGSKAAKQPPGVSVEVEGTFLGEPFGKGEANPPLSWDAVNGSPPTVPGSTTLLDLRYAGLGQHVGFAKQPETIPKVLEDLEASVLPVQPGALPQFGSGENELGFQPGSGWLIGADLTVMGTVSIAAVFNDPSLYGVRVGLDGKRAGIFAGLRFEILYRKVTDTIGVYHTELTLPTAMRTLQFGEVSLTLPVVDLDIYTNGNFRINLGFPKGLDFSASFCLQVFPFIGYGGFYFALLDGATSSKVPQITNGTFHPVLEFGVGLSVGIGKTIEEGVLSGGLSVTVVGIVEGVVAWFHPTDSSPEETYYQVHGSVAVTGHLFATIDFAIIQASIDVTAILSVTLAVESHQPIFIEATASVSVSVRVKIVLFTIHLSFHATISASFTIGSASPTPWKLASGGGAGLAAGPLSAGHRQALRRALVAAAVSPIESWPAVSVLGGVKHAPLWAITSFTQVEGSATGGDKPTEAIVLLGAPNSIPPHEEGGEEVAETGTAAFDLLMEAMLGWGIYAEVNRTTEAGDGDGIGDFRSSPVSADQLESLRQALALPATIKAAFDPETINRFLAANVVFDVNPAGTASAEAGVAVFPMAPAITLTDTAGTKVDFASFNEVSPAYQASVRAYFQSLQVRFEAAQQPAGTGAAAALEAVPGGASIATILFSQYFNMLMQQGVKAAIDLLAAFPFTVEGAAMGVAEIGAKLEVSEPLRILAPNQSAKVLHAGAQIELPHAGHQVKGGETLAGIAKALTDLGARDPSGGEYTGAELLERNLAPDSGGIFSTGVAVHYEGIVYTTQAGDTLDLLAARLLVRIGGGALLGGLPQLTGEAEALLKLNPKVSGASAPIPAGTTIDLPADGGTPAKSYTAVAGDTMTLIAAYRVATASQIISPLALVQGLLAENQPKVTDPAAEQPPGTALKLPQLERRMAAGDDVESIARTLVAGTAPIVASLLAAPASPQLLAPGAVLATPLQYTVASGDTLAGIAAKLGVTLTELAGPAAAAAELFEKGATLTVEDVPGLEIAALLEKLSAEGKWKTASGMVSRFLLSGLRLPDPQQVEGGEIAPDRLGEPATAATVSTLPLYALTGQQFGIAASPSPGYAITLSASGGGWLTLGGSSSVKYELTSEERNLLEEIAETALAPEVQSATRLALFRMLPPRTAVRRQIAWQAAAPPPALAGSGNPSLWMFPQPLLEATAGGEAPLYQLGVVANAVPDKAPEPGAYAWGTLVDLTVSLPQAQGDAPAVDNAYVVEGADDTGASLLQQLRQAVADGASAQLFLLYQPDPAGPRPSGLASDGLDPKATWLLKANLSTLTSSGSRLLGVAETDPTGVYSAPLEDAAGFLALLWEASITRSGGFYLNYSNADGGAGLPGTGFGNGSSARLSLLAILAPEKGAPAPGPIRPFHNCAVLGDAVDPTTATLVAQPVTWEVAEEGGSLTAAQQAFAKHSPGVSVLAVAQANESVPQLLRLGAQLALPGQSSLYTIAYGDTLASIVATHPGLTLAALVGEGGNATAEVLAPGAQMQLSSGVLSPSTTVPPGTVGFELARPDPDPENLPYGKLSPSQLIDSLFNLTAWSLAAGGGFTASGEGLPTTPTETGREWSYAQALAAAPFAETVHGSASPVLPPAAENPYNGIVAGSGRGEATLKLALQDIYGNRQQLPAGLQSVSVPVGYFDDVVALSAWPSLAISYLVEKPANVALSMTFHQERYVPSASLPVDSALAAITADLASYRRIHYQLAQPDLGLALGTTLSLDSTGKQIPYPLPKSPFLAFARGAYVYLAALANLKAVEPEVGGKTVEAVKEAYGVTGAELLRGNQDRLYSDLFGAAELKVPDVYTTVQDDTFDGIAARFKGLSVSALAEQNERVPLDPGTVLTTTPARKQGVVAGERLADVAAAARASVPGLARANATRTDILAAETEFAIGTRTYTTDAGDSLETVAEKLEATVIDVAVANQYRAGLLVAGAQLDVADVVVEAGETLRGLGVAYGTSAAKLAEGNGEVPNPFAPATSLEVGRKSPVGPQPSDTLLTFAQANKVTVGQLGAANAEAGFATGAKLQIPATLAQASGSRCTFAARSGETLENIAKLFGTQPSDLVELNPDLPGLLAAGQAIRDSTSGTEVTTVAEDTFRAITERFEAEHGVTVTPAQLAGDVAAQEGLLLEAGLWICPPMRGDAFGSNPQGSLEGLASAYGVDLETLATANAAVPGLLAAEKELDFPQAKQPIETRQGETFNSLVTRLQEAGVKMTIAEAAKAVQAVAELVEPAASVFPVPPSPPPDAVAIRPSFGETAFQLLVQVTAERDEALLDPDFESVASVRAAATAVAPEPDPGAEGSLGLTDFATRLQQALPALAVAVGPPAVEDDPTASSTVWCVNFEKLTYEFPESAASYFALPPLSPALMAETVEVKPYVSGTGLGSNEKKTFQAVDLDAWLDRFLAAVDAFLSPACAVPAYTTSAADVKAVVKAKQQLAAAISARVANVLAGSAETEDDSPPSSQAEAAERMHQAMLQRLGNASSASTLVQLPATVGSPSSDPDAAPRLSGRLIPAEDTEGEAPSSYSFSTAKLPLTDPHSTATFLFSVKAPSRMRHVSLRAGYVVSEIELPDPKAKIGEYEGSSWLKLVLPHPATEPIGLEIPVPLRAYPTPVTLVSQSAQQSFPEPGSAEELLDWDLGFAYQHDDAAQDSPLVEVSFNAQAALADAVSEPPEIDLQAVFAALAQFVNVEQPLMDDLSTLALLPAGGTSPTAEAAVRAFATIVGEVEQAFLERPPQPLAQGARPETFCYQLEREDTEGAEPRPERLTIRAIDSATGQPSPNPQELWPSVWAIDRQGTPVPLASEKATALEATYLYPAGIELDGVFEERYGFACGSGSAKVPPAASPKGTRLLGPKSFGFDELDVLARRNGRAGVSIWRNWHLLEGTETNPRFVYRTPVTRFPAVATPSVLATDPIELCKPGQVPPAQALGEFFERLTAKESWQKGETIPLRFGCGYQYTVAGSDGSPKLTAVTPIFLVPSVEFHPVAVTGSEPHPADWNWKESESFVAQVAALAEGWVDREDPSQEGGAFVFDLTAYGEGSLAQPLIHATTLRYPRPAPPGGSGAY